MSDQSNNFDDPNKPPPPPPPPGGDFMASTPPPPPPGAQPSSPEQEQQGVFLEPEPAQVPEIVPEGQGQHFQTPPPPPSPSPFEEEVYAEAVAEEWDDAVEEAEAVEEVEPAEEEGQKVKREPIAIEADPQVAGAEIIHERKALKNEYLAPTLDDEKAIFNAMLKEIKGIREEMEGLNKTIAGLLKKLENKL